MITGLQKLQKMENQTLSDHLDDLPNVDTKVEHQHRRSNWINIGHKKKKKKKRKLLDASL